MRAIEFTSNFRASDAPGSLYERLPADVAVTDDDPSHRTSIRPRISNRARAFIERERARPERAEKEDSC
jgi:hypothetical protein